MKPFINARLATCSLLLGTVAAPANADILYVAEGAYHRIDSYSSNGNSSTYYFGGATHPPSYPSELAFDSLANLYASDGFNSTIITIPPVGGATFRGLGISPTGVAFDGAGNFYSTDTYGTGTIYKTNVYGDISTFATGVKAIAIAFDNSGNLYAGNLIDNTIEKFTPGGVSSVFASGFNEIYGLAFDGAGNLFASNNSGFSISKITPTGNVSTFAIVPTNIAPGFYPRDLAFDSAGNLYASMASNNNGIIEKYNPSGVGSVFATGLPGPEGLAFTTDAGVPLLGASNQVHLSPAASGRTDLTWNDNGIWTRSGAHTAPTKGDDVFADASGPQGTEISFNGSIPLASALKSFTLSAGSGMITFNHSAGTLSTGDLNLNAGANYSLSNSAVSNVTGNLKTDASSSFQQTGGTLTVGNLQIGREGTGSYGNAPFYHLTGGTLSATTETVGNSVQGPGGALFQYGYMVQDGGQNSVGALAIATGSVFALGASYTLSGGTLTATSETIGAYGGGQGRVIQLGGSNNVTTLTINYGSYEIQGGILSAGSVFLNDQGPPDGLRINGFLETGAHTNATVGTTSNNFHFELNSGAIYTNTGTFTNNSFVYVNGATLNAGSFVQTSGATTFLENGGVIDPAVVDIRGGSFGGSGKVVGDVTVNGATIQAGGSSPGSLHVAGNYVQTGGALTFALGSGPDGGLVRSSLLLDPGTRVSITNTKIVFDFLNGTNPLSLFSLPGANVSDFFLESDQSVFDRTALGLGDTFAYEIGDGPLVDLAYDQTNGDLTWSSTTPVPELPTAWLLLGGLVALSSTRRARAALRL